jgi:uncharacterized secreted repeat protein (TIGR03808 family)
MASGGFEILCPTPRGFSPTRRDFLRLGAAGLLSAGSSRSASASADWLSAALREAARTGGAVRLPAGVTATRGLDIPDGVTLVGAPGRSILKLVGPGPLLSATGASRIALESIVFDGGGAYIEPKRGLLDFTDVVQLSVHGCAIRRSAARGVNLLRCGGRFAQNAIEHVQDAGYYSLDGLGVDIDGNHVRECGDNGVQVWTNVAGRYEGSRVRNNLIEDIHNISGGDGPYGNGVSIYGSGSVRVENNRIFRCAFTFVRNNAGHDVAVIRNICKGCDERAMFAEFGAKRSIFRDNRIEDAEHGIAVVNSEYGTDIGSVTGNTIVNLRETRAAAASTPDAYRRTAILAEKNCDISGNRIVGPAWIGIGLGGWCENIRAEGNTLIGPDYGFVFATGEGAGLGVIAGNKIAGARKAVIAAAAGENLLPGDVSAPGAAAKYPRLVVRDNEVS